MSRFIHDRKGDKYSALLPLLGLTEMEFAAENLHKLTRSVETESHITDTKARLMQMEQRQTDTSAPMRLRTSFKPLIFSI